MAVALPGCEDTYKQAPWLDSHRCLRIASVENIFPPLRRTDSANMPPWSMRPGTAVEAYGIIAGLPNTGSGDMDPRIREILIDQLVHAGADSPINGTQNINPERILASREISAVEVRGLIPPLARKGTTFDLVVNCLANSQTTSLANGLLWTSELKVIGLTLDGNDTRPVALGRGPVFISSGGWNWPPALTPVTTQPPRRHRCGIPRAMRISSARALGGGGVCAEDRPARLQLFTPNYALTHAIEMTINARFRRRATISPSRRMTRLSPCTRSAGIYHQP